MRARATSCAAWDVAFAPASRGAVHTLSSAWASIARHVQLGYEMLAGISSVGGRGEGQVGEERTGVCVCRGDDVLDFRGWVSVVCMCEDVSALLRPSHPCTCWKYGYLEGTP